jgi:hypothetical protein
VVDRAFPEGERYAVGAVSYGGSTPTNAAQLLHMAEQHMTGAAAGTAPRNAQPQLA